MMRGYANASLIVEEAHRVGTCEPWRLPGIGIWSLREYWRRYKEQISGDYNFPSSFIADVRSDICLSLLDFFFISSAALLFTFLRLRLTENVFLPLTRWLETPKALEARVPESLFKILFYASSTLGMWSLALGSWGWVWNDPMTIFRRWDTEKSVSWDIYSLYVSETGFYVHSIYATLWLDSTRKDAVVMMIHHVATLLLLLFSLGTRHHLSGLLVLLCHDLCDVFLELWKLNSSLRRRAGSKYYGFHDTVAAVCFVIFASSWAILRLYFFPLKVLYAVYYGPVVEGLVPLMPFYPIYVSLLTLLFAMNSYWFALILYGVYQFVFGDLKEIDDIREYDDQDGQAIKRD